MIGFDGKCSIKKKISSYTMYIFHILGPIFEIYTIKLMPIKCTTFAFKTRWKSVFICLQMQVDIWYGGDVLHQCIE